MRVSHAVAQVANLVVALDELLAQPLDLLRGVTNKLGVGITANADTPLRCEGHVWLARPVVRRRNANGPASVARGADARKGRKSQAPRRRLPEALRRS
jgi:hypothetical protein